MKPIKTVSYQTIVKKLLLKRLINIKRQEIIFLLKMLDLLIFLSIKTEVLMFYVQIR